MEEEETLIIPLSADTISKLHNGVFGSRINDCIDKIVKDIVDRPINGAGKHETRKLNIKLEFIPETTLEEGAHRLEAINVEGTVSGDIPVYRTKRTDVRIRGGRVMFNQHNPEQFHQPTLAFKDEVRPDTLEK